MWLYWEESAGSEYFVDVARSDFVPVVFAQGQVEADRYRGLLEAVGIPAVVERAGGGEAELCLAAGGVVLLRVPEHLHDTASEIVASAQHKLRGGIDDDLDEDEDDDFDEDDDYDPDEDDLDDPV